MNIESNTVEISTQPAMVGLQYISNTLHLNLISKWFDLILSGEKKEEYREITSYWINRLTWHEFHKLTPNQVFYKYIDGFDVLKRNHDFITFSNGYSKNRRQFIIEFKSMKIDYGESKWGAIPYHKYFVLQLGNIISSNCC